MKKILLSLMIMAGTCLAEVYNVTIITQPKCNSLQYDSFTHKWTPEKCSGVIECFVSTNKYKIPPKLEIAFNLKGKTDTYTIHDGAVVLDELSGADFSLLLNAGAIGTCSQSQAVFITPK